MNLRKKQVLDLSSLIGGDVSPQSDSELEPWLVFDGETVCTWNIGSLNSEALAIFSSSENATAYLAKVHAERTEQLSERPLLSLLISAFKSGIEHIALDPSSSECAKVFNLRDVLRAAKQKYGLG